ncbi:MAG: hypothetical protein R2828_21000 [Saprospiraceae bacterium]
MPLYFLYGLRKGPTAIPIEIWRERVIGGLSFHLLLFVNQGGEPRNEPGVNGNFNENVNFNFNVNASYVAVPSTRRLANRQSSPAATSTPF